MKYLVTGKTANTGKMLSPEQFTQVIDKGIILSLEAFNNLGIVNNKIFKKMFASKKTGVAIVEADSHTDVNDILQNCPPWLKVNWNVMPLENF
jgi:hypothetical protein